MTLHLVAAKNLPAVRGKFGLLAAYIGLDSADSVPFMIESLLQQIPTIPTFRKLGASRDDLEFIAAHAFQPLLTNNVVPLTQSDILNLLSSEI